MDWNHEAVALLRQRWGENVPASQIAIELGAASRNAVIGKAHRIGLAGRGKATVATRPKGPRPQRTRCFRPNSDGVVPELPQRTGRTGRASERREREADVVVRREHMENEELYPLPPEIGAKPCDFKKLRTTAKNGQPPSCRYIVGHPHTEHYFCGADATPAVGDEEKKLYGNYRPWCEYHAILCRGNNGRIAAARYLEVLRYKIKQEKQLVEQAS